MSALLRPGDHRAGTVFDDGAVLAAMVRVEAAWLGALAADGLAPAAGGLASTGLGSTGLDGLVGAADLPALARAGEDGGNPVIPLVALLRERLTDRGDADFAPWLHRGLTSQDVLDTALVLCAREACGHVGTELAAQARALAALADTHRGTPMIGRTLTQHAVPITFGAKAASWLQGVLDAADDVAALRFPGQFGGAAGTLSAAADLAGDPARAVALAARACATLGLDERGPWHTARAPVTRIGAALAGACAAWGRIANDVLLLARPETGELREPDVPGRGGSSSMPHKHNPVLSVLVRRAALAAPGLLGELVLAAGEAHDERPAGSWHLEWPALQQLARQSVAAGSQATELVTGLQVDAGRMAATLAASVGPAADVPGAVDLLIDAAVARARGRS